VACGAPGHVCCTSLPACADAIDYGCVDIGMLAYCLHDKSNVDVTGEPGWNCSSTCSNPSDSCEPLNGFSWCLECGGIDDYCCDGTTCQTGLSCTSGYCQ
jgi:hypothetical protein